MSSEKSTPAFTDSTFERVQRLRDTIGIAPNAPLAYEKSRTVRDQNGNAKKQTVFVMRPELGEMLELCPVSLDDEKDKVIQNTLRYLNRIGEQVVAAGYEVQATEVGRMMLAAKRSKEQQPK